MDEIDKPKDIVKLFIIFNLTHLIFYFTAFPYFFNFLYSSLVCNYICLIMYIKDVRKLLLLTLFLWCIAFYFSNSAYLINLKLLFAYSIFLFCFFFKTYNTSRTLIGLTAIYVLKEQPQLVSMKEIMESLNYLLLSFTTLLLIQYIKPDLISRSK